jgi:hypothetical protein
MAIPKNGLQRDESKYVVTLDIGRPKEGAEHVGGAPDTSK